jgi:phosphatidate cytidylyltransferase
MDDKNRNLIARVVTALVLLPAVLWLIWLGGVPFSLLVAVAAALCAWEVNHLPSQAAAESPAPSAAAIASVAAAFLLPLAEGVDTPGLSAQGVLAFLIIVAFADALLFEPELTRAPQRVGLALLGAAYPGLLLATVVSLRELSDGIGWVVLLLAATWLNDTGAYFAGRAFGRNKLYPRISPNKTVEGAVGGLIASVAGALGAKIWGLPSVPWWVACLIGLGAGIFGPLGDLSESMLKRAFGAKDSSGLLPGHGGVLDRIDALLFTAPFVLLCARVFLWLR